MDEKVMFPLPCGHLINNREVEGKVVFQIRCELCDKAWDFHRVHQTIEYRSV